MNHWKLKKEKMKEMAIERTLAIIKPNAMKEDVKNEVIHLLLKSGLRIHVAKEVHLTLQQAMKFYEEHKEKPFFQSMTQFMSSAPVYVMCLEGEKAITLARNVMGATDPAQAQEGTIRRRFGDSIEANAIHGSDSPSAASREISYFFSRMEYSE